MADRIADTFDDAQALVASEKHLVRRSKANEK